MAETRAAEKQRVVREAISAAEAAAEDELNGMLLGQLCNVRMCMT